MARNFREKNKFLYDVQHESASYFMDRMIKILDEDKEEGLSTPYGFLTDAQKKQGLDLQGSLNIFNKNDVSKLSVEQIQQAIDNPSFEYMSPEIKGAIYQRASTLNAGTNAGAGIPARITYNGDSTPGFVERVTTWMRENPGMTVTYGALAAAGLAGAYYLYKKWNEKGEVDENDMQVAKKLDAENA